MIMSFIMSVVAVLAIAAICITISAKSILAGVFISFIGIGIIFAIAIVFLLSRPLNKSHRQEEDRTIIDAEM